MADVNHVVLIGRLTRDVEVKYTTGGIAVAKGSIAVNKRVKQGDQWTDKASFFDFTLWGKQAESIAKYLVKGKQIAIDGELEQNRWQNEGKSMSKIEIKANDVQLLGGDKQNTGQSQAERYERPDVADFPDTTPDGIPF